jgi:Tfp pilus assembly protein PilN
MKEKRKKFQTLRNNIAIIIIFLSILFFGLYFPNISLNRLKFKENNLNNQVVSFNNTRSENEKLKGEIASIKNYIDRVDTLKKQKVSVYSGIKGIEQHIPSEINVNSLSYANGVINISGKTKNYDSISAFSANLKMSKMYSVADVSSINFNNQTMEYTFSLTISNTGGSGK